MTTHQRTVYEKSKRSSQPMKDIYINRDIAEANRCVCKWHTSSRTRQVLDWCKCASSCRLPKSCKGIEKGNNSVHEYQPSACLNQTLLCTALHAVHKLGIASSAVCVCAGLSRKFIGYIGAFQAGLKKTRERNGCSKPTLRAEGV